MAAIQKVEKKKPGPSTYTISQTANRLAFEDRNGIYNGCTKKGTEQLQFLQHVRTLAKEIPQVSHYKINYVSTIFKYILKYIS